MAKASLQRGEFCSMPAIVRNVWVSYPLSTFPVSPKQKAGIQGCGGGGALSRASSCCRELTSVPGDLQQTAKSLWGANASMCCREPWSVGAVGHSQPGHQPEEGSRHSGTEQKDIQTDWQTIKSSYASTRHCGSSRRLWSSAEGLLQVQTAAGWASTSALGITNTSKIILKCTKNYKFWNFMEWPDFSD